MEWGNIAEWALVIITLFLTLATISLALVAAFQDIIRGWLTKPKLDIEIEVKPQDCHRATALMLAEGNRVIGQCYQYYFRYKIWNNGNVSAKNVEVIIKDIMDAKGNFIEQSLDNLLWSNLEMSEPGKYIFKIYCEYISPDTYQYCNLGHVTQPNKRKEIPSEYNNALFADDNESIFSFSVYWKTPDLRYLIAKGKYSFEIIAGCENGKTVTKKYEMEITGFWSEDEEDMLKNGFRIKEVK